MKLNILLLFAGTTATTSALRGAKNDEGNSSRIYKRRSLGLDRCRFNDECILGESCNFVLGSRGVGLCDESSFFTVSSSSDRRSCKDIAPTSIREDRDGQGFIFGEKGDEGTCIDSSSANYDYGEENGIDNVEDCAERCINILRFEKNEHLVGFDYNCERRLCRCLYDDNELERSDRNEFSSYDRSNGGAGSVDGVEAKRGWNCYTSGNCAPTSVSDTRDGQEFIFEQEKEEDEGTCIDRSSEDYDYGEENSIVTAADCAKRCINVLDSEKVEHLVGFDYNCEERLCRCLYDDNELDQIDKNKFNANEIKNIGLGSVDGVEEKIGWKCYTNINYIRRTVTPSVSKTPSSQPSSSFIPSVSKMPSIQPSSSSIPSVSKMPSIQPTFSPISTESPTSKPSALPTCIPPLINENRAGQEFIFEQEAEEDEGTCVDSSSEDYDYGEETRINNAEDCADHCINMLFFIRIEHLVGFDYNCEESLCRCLYDDNELQRSDGLQFSSYDTSNSGSSSVDRVEAKSGWKCYAKFDVSSSSSSNGNIFNP